MEAPLISGLECQLQQFLKANNVGTLKPPAWIITENSNAVHLNISWPRLSPQCLEDLPKVAVKPRKHKSSATRRRDKSRLQKWLSAKTSSPEKDVDVLLRHAQKDEAPGDPFKVLKAPAYEKAGEHVENSNIVDKGSQPALDEAGEHVMNCNSEVLVRPPALNKAGEHSDPSSSTPTGITPPASASTGCSTPNIIPISTSTTPSSTTSALPEVAPSSIATPPIEPLTLNNPKDSSVTSDYANDAIRNSSPEPVRRSRRLQGRPPVAEEMVAEFSRSHLLLAQMMANLSA